MNNNEFFVYSILFIKNSIDVTIILKMIGSSKLKIEPVINFFLIKTYSN